MSHLSRSRAAGLLAATLLRLLAERHPCRRLPLYKWRPHPRLLGGGLRGERLPPCWTWTPLMSCRLGTAWIL